MGGPSCVARMAFGLNMSGRYPRDTRWHEFDQSSIKKYGTYLRHWPLKIEQYKSHIEQIVTCRGSRISEMCSLRIRYVSGQENHIRRAETPSLLPVQRFETHSCLRANHIIILHQIAFVYASNINKTIVCLVQPLIQIHHPGPTCTAPRTHPMPTPRTLNRRRHNTRDT